MQYEVWEREYRDSVLLRKEGDPQKDTLRFLKFLKKDREVNLENLNILDLGSGTGRNANYLAELGNNVWGIEISDTAIKIAKERANEMGLKNVQYVKQSMGEKYSFPNEFFDLVIDVTSSNSLNEKEREVYLSEVNRVLKKDGYFFVKTLCKEGDKNAQNLLKISPGYEPDTYIMKELGLHEKVFSRESFIETYSNFFEIINLLKKSNYTRLNNMNYKRNFWLAYMQK